MESKVKLSGIKQIICFLHFGQHVCTGDHSKVDVACHVVQVREEQSEDAYHERREGLVAVVVIVLPRLVGV